MRSARAEELTAAEYLQLVTEEHARRQRFAGVQQAYAGESRSPDRDYDEVTGAWDEALAGGLDDAWSAPRDVLFVALRSMRGREQAGQWPALIVASNDYPDSVPHLIIAPPVATTDRGWPRATSSSRVID